jgi:hypothetical protein
MLMPSSATSNFHSGLRLTCLVDGENTPNRRAASEGLAKGEKRTLPRGVGQLQTGREGARYHMYIAIDTVPVGQDREPSR